MGHSSINVTLDRYGHRFRELDEAVTIAFEASLQEVATLRWEGAQLIAADRRVEDQRA